MSCECKYRNYNAPKEAVSIRRNYHPEIHIHNFITGKILESGRSRQ